MVNAALDKALITTQTQDVDVLSKIIAEKFRDQFVKNYLCTDIPGQYDEAPHWKYERLRHRSWISLIKEQVIDQIQQPSIWETKCTNN